MFEFATVVAVVSAIAAVASIYHMVGERRARRKAESSDDFDLLRVRLSEQRGQLTQQARADVAADHWVLAAPGWIPSAPVPLDQVELEWVDQAPDISEARSRAARIRPFNAGGRRLRSLSGALLDRDEGLYDGRAYRLLDVRPDDERFTLRFGPSSYFEGLDTTEVLAYEYMEGRATDLRRRATPYRRWLHDPFDLERRSGIPGICTLTIRRDGERSSFLLLERDGQVSMGNGMLHVVPAGEFQPADESQVSLRRDLDLWRTLQREFAEELLGHEDARGKRGRAIDFANEQPYADLDRLREGGRLDVALLGVGLDPLTWKPEILLVCAIDAEPFDELMSARVDRSEEGLIVVGDEHGIPFTREMVRQQLASPRLLPAAAACLELASEHRTSLGLG
jgi:hypothetical protein